MQEAWGNKRAVDGNPAVLSVFLALQKLNAAGGIKCRELRARFV